MLFPNEGWESGDLGGWSISVYGMVTVPIDATAARSGNYGLHQSTALGVGVYSRVTFTITDPVILAALAGKTITFKVWSWCDFIFAGSGDINNIRQIEVGDNVGGITQALPTLPYETWQEVEVSKVIDDNPTFVFFEIYYYKAGGAHIYEIRLDDMESDPVSAIQLPTVTTDPATEVT
ncbi:hypothetical protein ES703_08339 [subsurface metagenome]